MTKNKSCKNIIYGKNKKMPIGEKIFQNFFSISIQYTQNNLKQT